MKTLSIINYCNNFFSKLNNNNTYYKLLFIVILFYSFISFESISFDLYFNNLYENYAKFFKSFKLEDLKYEPTTFPLWGYGLFHLLGKKVIIFLIIQQALTFYVLIYLDKLIRTYKLIDNIYLLRLIILLSTPWFLFHTQMWPKSISANLLVLGVLSIIHYLLTKEYIRIIYSAILFGILNNFRSDYIYLSLIIFIVLIMLDRFNFKSLFYKLQFISIQFLLIIPWMLFTFNQIGKPLITSTNSGHVLFIGLGQLPENKWGITPFDKDSLKLELLNKRFQKDYSKVDYAEWNQFEENEFLKKEFFKRAQEDPFEWIKKCLYSIRLITFDPFYVGNVGNFQQNKISNINEIRILENLVYQLNFKDSYDLIRATKWRFSFKEILQLVFTIYTKLIGIIIFSFSIFIYMISILKFMTQKYKLNKIDIILFLCIMYQLAISIFAFHMPVYNTSMYLLYILLSYRLFQKNLSIKQ